MAAASLLLLTGCSGAVELPDPTPDAAARAVCDGLLGSLPATVLNGTRRPTKPGGLTAAWGDPPITLSCGVPVPPGLTAASECLEVQGVGWFAEEVEGGMLYTTIGRRAFVELGVPEHYAPEAGALVDVAAAVSARDPLQQPCQ